MTTIAFIGLGNMGAPMAANLANAGHEVTGFDVALESIAQSASDAPAMLGADAGDFGLEWERLTQEVFAPDLMQTMALDILEDTLSSEALFHAAEFYASDLGQRLVVAENASHQNQDATAAREAGEQLISDLVENSDPRVALYRDMNTAIGGTDTAIRAVQEIQFRFLMAASAAGVIDMRIDADGLRALMKAQEGEMRRSMAASSLANSAYTYRDFSADEVAAYVEALEDPLMQEVYELLNAIQYEIQANRFEASYVASIGADLVRAVQVEMLPNAPDAHRVDIHG